LLSFSFVCIFPTLTIEGLVRCLGIFASLAALMFNCVRQDKLQDYSPFDDGEACRYFQLHHFQQFTFLAFPESSAVCQDIYVILISSKCFLS